MTFPSVALITSVLENKKGHRICAENTSKSSHKYVKIHAKMTPKPSKVVAKPIPRSTASKNLKNMATGWPEGAQKVAKEDMWVAFGDSFCVIFGAICVTFSEHWFWHDFSLI